ncbi:proliferation-associated protein 2G4-like protein [Gonapodya prolifera JEL478]|uniref:Proliferation-associated protein 2G4-like protein n=1 Tax=Gonapodya prolifera (strain JEL478) TaxID=1344416 RepID=A0A139B0J8_GONPJ|nr:proliferation-associated protein 2G4-like protein [Gonapodya prolifera JEL478]|eukprot:KXS22499.1 proliferation-associated protein 2G4-like protein [Gonapodya prolifera JEL478]
MSAPASAAKKKVAASVAESGTSSASAKTTPKPKSAPAPTKKPAPAPVEEDDDDSVSSVSVSDDEEAKVADEDKGLEDPNVVTKYKTAADIANRALRSVLAACTDGASVLHLCMLGDRDIEEQCAKVYKTNDIKKGIAFPTTVSPNPYICHLSPLSTDAESRLTLSTGDVVRVELGAHVDGYPALVGHTIVVGASKEKPVDGRIADAMTAAHFASEAALRCLKPGFANFDVTDHVQKIAEDFGCKPVEGMLSHSLSRHVIDGDKSIILAPTDAQRKDHESCQFEDGESWTVDVLISTGDGKAKQSEARTTVFKRVRDTTYHLRMKTSRETLTDTKKFAGMAFSLRAFDDERKARMGIVECQNHNLVMPYPVLQEKEGETVAHFMFTVLLMPTGPQKITGLPFEADVYRSEKAVKDEKAKEILRTGLRKSTAPKKSKKKSKTGGSSANGQNDEADA